MSFLSRIEEFLLIAIWKLKDNAFGLAIIDQVEKDTGISWMSGSIYGALTRLKKNGYVETTKVQQSPGHMGRPRIHYELTKLGMAKLIAVQKVNNTMWEGVPNLEKCR